MRDRGFYQRSFVERLWAMLALSAAAATASGLVAPAAMAQTSDPPTPQAPAALAPPLGEPLKVDALAWDPRWGRFSNGELVLTGGAAVVAIASLAVPPFKNTWSGTNPLDTSVRDTFRLGDATGRNTARDTSDLLLSIMLSQLMVDSLVVTWWGHGRGSTAAEMALIDMEVLAVTAAIQGAATVVTGRERPYASACTGRIEEQNHDCTGSKRHRSYFSGHTAISFATAGLLCQHHAQVPIYGGGAVEPIFACTAAFMAASAVGTTRILSDQHFASDVLTGALLGAATGLGLPWLLHYRNGSSQALKPGKPVSIHLVPGPLGGSIVGEF